MSTGIENLIVYKKSFILAMNIYQVSKGFPKDEKYSLTDQIRRSSRAVNANLAEAYSKRRYEAHFISKLTDADMENNETQVWLKFSLECNYISIEVYNEFTEISKEVGRLLNYMIQNPEKFSIRSKSND
jgi:four helix bundle protein